MVYISKQYTYILLGVLSFLLGMIVYHFNPSIIMSIEDKINDILMLNKINQSTYKSQNVAIVDIDEKSLKHLGQWPWSRDKVAKIIDNLNKANVGLIGLDITFGEPDGKSPSFIFDANPEYVKPKNIKNYDEILAKSLANSPSIMGTMMYFGESKEDSNKNNNIVESVAMFSKIDTSLLINASKLIGNLPILQNSGLGSGFLNVFPDSDGVIRYIPMIASYANTIYPSMSLEIVSLAFGSQEVQIYSNELGLIGMGLGDIFVQTDLLGRFLVNYKGMTSYEYISAYDIYKNDFDKEKIQSKIILIGTSALGLVDNRQTPLGLMPGVQIHANVIDNILQQDYLFKMDNLYIDIFIFILIISLLVFFSLWEKIFTGIFFSVLVLILIIVFAYMYFEKYSILISIMYPIVVWMIAFLILMLYRVFSEQKQKQKISSMFSKKVSKKVMKNLLSESGNITTARQKQVSILFSDIRGFTPISEKLEPIKLVEFLNEYMTPMADIIDEYSGTVDKFIGDAIMAYWNAPYDLEDHADYCLKSAIAQIVHLKKIKKNIYEKYEIDLDIGIGINTGEVIAGDIGSSGRSDYTIIGDGVNLAARVESLNKQYKANIIITQYTKDALRGEYNIKFLDSVVVKGKSNAVKIYEVIAE